jgi:hypothetical protein
MEDGRWKMETVFVSPEEIFLKLIFGTNEPPKIRAQRR